MHEIFISYRRADTGDVAGFIYESLTQTFGDDSVFMDREGGIAPGCDYEHILQNALEGCEACLALIGPKWLTCTRSDGRRRLDVPEDWVRREIVTAVSGKKFVVPVLLKDASAPQESDLPQELATLRFDKLQACAISESHRKYDMDQFVGVVVANNSRLSGLYNMKVAGTGIRSFEHLITTNPTASDAVSHSWRLIATEDLGIDEVGKLKVIHEALHEIESKCLIPLRPPPNIGEVDRVRFNDETKPSSFMRKFKQNEAEIQQLLKDLQLLFQEKFPPLLEIEIPTDLQAASQAFEDAVKSDDDFHRNVLIGALETLIGETLSETHDLIGYSARSFELRQLTELMNKVVGLLAASSAAGGAELEPLRVGSGALAALSDELSLRLREHGLLQLLDNKLRLTLSHPRGEGRSGLMDPEQCFRLWNYIKFERAHFAKTYTPEMEAGLPDLEGRESLIEKAVATGNSPEATKQLDAYFNEVGELFREIDTKLKEFSIALRGQTAPLKTILAQVRHV